MADQQKVTSNWITLSAKEFESSAVSGDDSHVQSYAGQGRRSKEEYANHFIDASSDDSPCYKL